MVQTTPQVPDTNRTTLGLYVTPREAYEMWKANPDGVTVLDVRTFEEYIFGGHAEMARNVPLVFPKFQKATDNKAAANPAPGGRPAGCTGEFNPDFVAAVRGFCSPTDTILAMCATGGRGAMAVNELAKAGFTNVYNIINGFEGDRVDDPGSVYHGKHMRNGWKNLGVPWGYDFDPDLMWETRSK
jgi:rhodanese-related sulfurtransferase